MSNQLEWKECVVAWLEMEHRLGYPVGMVIISNVLSKFLEVTLNTTSRQKKGHKLDKYKCLDVITNWQKSGCKYIVMLDLSDKLPGFAALRWKCVMNIRYFSYFYFLSLYLLDK